MTKREIARKIEDILRDPALDDQFASSFLTLKDNLLQLAAAVREDARGDAGFEAEFAGANEDRLAGAKTGAADVQSQLMIPLRAFLDQIPAGCEVTFRGRSNPDPSPARPARRNGTLNEVDQFKR